MPALPALDKKRLRSRPPHQLSTVAPWMPVSTGVAANFLKVHSKTLLLWVRLGLGPEHEPRDLYVGNHLYWQLGKVLAWYERNCLPEGEGRSFEQICKEWRVEQAYVLTLFSEWPSPRKRPGRRTS